MKSTPRGRISMNLDQLIKIAQRNKEIINDMTDLLSELDDWEFRSYNFMNFEESIEKLDAADHYLTKACQLMLEVLRSFN